jgi:cyclopropane-fatty-acyl-phospholipid synthase
MNSMMYTGWIDHTRHQPVYHHLRYRLYVYGIDLGDLDRLDRRLPLFGYNRFRPATINDRDYLDQGPGTIPDKLKRLVEADLPETTLRRIVLVTSPRYFNYVFNPVSFYYCFDAGERFAAAVVEVNNTFGERHVYVLPNPNGSGFPATFEARKQFHVSPFNRVEGIYRFSFGDIRRELDIRIELWRDQQLAFDARLKGTPVPLKPLTHLKVMASQPLIPHLSIPRIYWQAARLKFQRQLTYHPKPIPVSPNTIKRNPPTPIQRQCMKMVFRVLEAARVGSLKVILPGHESRTFGDLRSDRPVILRINDYGFFWRVATAGDIGFGEAFMAGEWESDDVTGVVRFFIRNRETIKDGRFRSTVLAKAVDLAVHLARSNTLPGTRRNIRRHYDLSNAFFKTFLDPTMLYSCGLFETPEDSLETAQINKIRRLIEMTRIQPGDHVLDIGCGWGGFAIEAARRTGCRVTGITVSRAQHLEATRRVRAAGLSNRITIRLIDYRKLRGRFDKIVSIEMLEAVGHRFFGTFFSACDRLLAPNGLVALQTITIPDPDYDRYRREVDWIQKHIFPGGLLPSVAILTQAMANHSALTVERLDNIGIHYAKTLRHWRQRFVEKEERVADLGFDKTFRRKWLYYLSSCEAGFAERVLGDVQMLLTRPGNSSLPADTSP